MERRIGAAVGAIAAEGVIPVKIQAVGTRMGIDPVQNHPNAVGMGAAAQGGKVRLGAQHGVRGLVVAGIVAVGGKALADGV